MSETVGFLLFNGMEELDMVGPWEVFSIWSRHCHGPEKLVTVSQEAGVITCIGGLQLIANADFTNCPPLDYLIVPGGMGERSESHNEKLVNFISERAIPCKAVLSICTGSLLLQAAGLLDGKKATTHWKSLERLRKFEKTTVVEERWVKDGKIWSSAGISSGIDLALALIAEVAGEDIAGKVQFDFEYYPTQKFYGDLHQSSEAPAYLKKEGRSS